MSDDPAPGWVRVRLDLSYDGAKFSGWAKQRTQRTVQGELESAIQTVLRLPDPVELTVAGRTDAGVHARGQVAHVDLPEDIWAAESGKLRRRLAGRLPWDVRVWRVSQAAVASMRASPRSGGATRTGSATTPAASTRCCAAMCCGTTARWTWTP